MKSLRNSVSILALCSALTATPALAQMQGGPFQNGSPFNPSVTGSDTSAGMYFGTNRTGINGHFEAGIGSGDIPVLSGCGTTPNLISGSSDIAGSVILGTTATGCVITFGTAYSPSAPSCTVTWQSTPLASQSYTVTAAAITLVQTSTSNNIINYMCAAKSGG